MDCKEKRDSIEVFKWVKRVNRGDVGKGTNLKSWTCFSGKEHSKNGPGKASVEKQKVKFTLFLLEIHTVKDIMVRSNKKSSSHLSLSCKVGLNLRRERKKLTSKKHPNISAVKEKAKDFT